MGCASSAALPFLTGRGTQAMGGSANGKMNGVKEGFVTEKVAEVADSSPVRGVIDGVINAKDEMVHQVEEAGEAVASKVSSMVEGVEESIDSTMSQITQKIEEVEDKVKSEVMEIGEKLAGSEAGEEKRDEIDQLLAELPDEAEIAKTTAEELIEEATEEVTQDEMKE